MSTAAPTNPAQDPDHPPFPAGTEIAMLGGGCFWCLEAVYDALDGVLAVASGYAGGHVAEPDYRAVCDGDTGHAEVVRIAFVPERISYAELLDVFFTIHDPTTPNRQGNDVGPQYRSVIFWTSDDQRRIAGETIARLTAEHAFPNPIVTELAPAPTFWPAEGYHQNYFRHNAAQPYCQYVVAPKLAKFRARFGDRLRPDA